MAVLRAPCTFVRTGQKALDGLTQYMRDMQSFRGRSMKSLAQALVELILEGDMIRKAPFVRGDCHEQLRQAQLFLEVHESCMIVLPELRRIRFGGQSLACGAARRIACASDRGKQPQVVDSS